MIADCRDFVGQCAASSSFLHHSCGSQYTCFPGMSGKEAGEARETHSGTEEPR